VAERKAPPPEKDDAYRSAEVTELVNQLGDDFARRDDLYRTIEKCVHSEYALNVPEAYQATAMQIRTPLALNVVNTVTAALSVNPPSVNCEPLIRGLKGQQNAEKREHFFEASWARQESDSRRPLLRLFMGSLVAKGEGVLKTVERSKAAWGEYRARSKKLLTDLSALDDGVSREARDEYYDEATEEYKKAAPYPIATTDVPPEQFRYWRNEDGFTACAEVSEVPYLECLARYQQGLDARGHVVPQAYALPRAEWQRVMGNTRTVRRIEYWDYKECVTVLCGPGQARNARKATGGQIVRRITNHGYGNPWTKTLNGPYFHAQGIVTPSRLPEKAGLGVLYGFLSLFPALDTYLTIQSNSAFLTGFAAFRRRTPAGQLVPGIPVTGPGSAQTGAAYGQDAGDLQGRERIEPGYIYPYDLEPLEMPKSGPDLDKVILALRALIEISLPSVVSGVISGDESGYALNQAAHLARLAWDPIVRNAERALGERTSWESWLIEKKVREPVYAFGDAPGAGTRPVLLGRSRMAAHDTARSLRSARQSWLSIGPEDLNGYHRYTVRLDPETPSNRVIEVRTHTEMVAQGFETRAQAIEALGGDPAEVQRGRMVEALMEDPEIMARLRKRTFQRLGILTQDAAGPGQQGQPGANGAQQLIPPGATMSPNQAEGFEAGAPDVFQPGQAGAPLMNGQGGPASAPGNAASNRGGQGLPPLANAAPRVQGPTMPGRHIPLPGGG
jgi:hypothetical protein